MVCSPGFGPVNTSGMLGVLLLSSIAMANAADLNIVGPTGSVAFGTRVVALPNGNIVVTDPEGPVGNIGAVYLYSPNRTLLATLTGGSNGDAVGSGGIRVVGDGNFLVFSPSWRNPSTNATKAGAVTWVNGTTGLSASVFEGNSLVGTSINDGVGSLGAVVLDNGNYLISVPTWDNGPIQDAGAVVWGNGSVGISGPVTTSNALFGTTASDQVGRSITALRNGNYVVCSSQWDNGSLGSDSGAATWGDGLVGVIGAVSPANSLISAKPYARVGSRGALALRNGNYVVSSPTWQNGTVYQAGAATWANGSTGLVGVVSLANSLVGSTYADVVGDGGIIALANGNYVVSSPGWANGLNKNAGAATWGNGSTGISGTVSAGNSLVGLGAEDGTPLAVAGHRPVVALANGNYVVVNPGWNNGAIVDVGAVTWANGATGRSGVITTANSLIGSVAGDGVGSSPTVPLTNGNYVVGSNRVRRGALSAVGAATWANGTSGRVGVVSASNSLVGSSANDNVGRSIYALENGNYVVAADLWDDADNALVDVGAVVWRSGSAGSGTVISRLNALAGTHIGDFYGRALLTLVNGDFVAGSANWDRGNAADAGAFTHVDGTLGLVSQVTLNNSFLGAIDGDKVAAGGRVRLGDNYYAIISPGWNNLGIGSAGTGAGAVTIMQNSARTSGFLSADDSVFGGAAGGGNKLNVTYDSFMDRAIVSRTAENRITLRKLSLFAHGFE